MIIWGSRGMKSVKASGPFHCPRCGPEKTYNLVHVNRWFTLYFIPLFPIGTAGSYTECQSCAGTFDANAVNYDPEVAHREFMAKLDTALVRSLLVLANASSPATDSDLMNIAALMQRTTGRELELERMHILLAEVQERKMTVKAILTPLLPSLNNGGKNLVLNALVEAAPAMDTQQRKIVEEAGLTLGFAKKDIQPLLVPALVSPA